MSRGKELISKFLDDDLCESEIAEFEAWLIADKDNLQQFVDTVARDEQLRRMVSVAKSPTIQQHQQPAREKSRPRIPQVAKWMTVACLVLVTTWFVLPSQNNASVVTFEGSSGPVSLRTLKGGQSGLQSGETFTVGTLQIGGEGTRAKFSYDDGSRLSIAGGAEIEFAHDHGKKLVLQRGTMQAKISPQPKKSPLIVLTPTAEAIVKGTAFVVDSSDSETLLQVDEGTLQIRRLADDQTLMLAQNEEVIAQRDAVDPLESRPVKPLPTTWKATPKLAGNVNWKGNWSDDGILKAEATEIFRKDIRAKENHYHAGVHDDFPGLFRLEENSAIRIRYRINTPLNVGLFLSTHSKTWNFTGNFQAYIVQDLTPPDENGWRTATVPLTSFNPTQRTGFKFQPGTVAATIFATTYASDVGLEVAELEVIELE